MKVVANMKHRTCRICGFITHPLVDDELGVTYDVCNNCYFIYKQEMYHPTLKVEKERYLKHHNSEDNMQYVTYMESFIKEAIEPLSIKGKILDFGSGPVPILKRLLQDRKYDVHDFDPFFNNDLSYQNHSYELIILTEVLEHIVNPLHTLKSLFTYLEQDGKLLIQTQLHNMDEQKFLKWWYRRDISHVGFYHTKTMKFLAEMFNLKIIRNNLIDQVTFMKVG